VDALNGGVEAKNGTVGGGGSVDVVRVSNHSDEEQDPHY
jgi:hypothetical protein